jgi:hypothetical protein
LVKLEGVPPGFGDPELIETAVFLVDEEGFRVVAGLFAEQAEVHLPEAVAEVSEGHVEYPCVASWRLLLELLALVGG